MKDFGRLFLSNLRRLLKSYEIYLSILGAAAALVFSIEEFGLINGNVLDTYIHSTELSGVMVAYVFCAFPFATAFCEDLENKYIRYEVIRGNLKKYVCSKISLIYLSSVTVMCLGTLVFLLGCRTMGPWTNESSASMEILLLGNYSSFLQSGKYLMYCMLSALQLGLLAGFLSVLSAYFSLYISNRVTVLALPIVIYQIMIEMARNSSSMYNVFIFRVYSKPMAKDWQSFLLIFLISFLPSALLGILIYRKIRKRL